MKNYAILETGDVIQKGDEIWEHENSTWVKINEHRFMFCIDRVFGIDIYDKNLIRRRLPDKIIAIMDIAPSNTGRKITIA